MNRDLHRRLRVLIVRQRVEMCSWVIYSRTVVLPAEPVWHRNVASRLGLLHAWTSTEHEFHELRSTASALSWVYRACCDVLHGRRAHTALCEPEVAGWEAAVERGERVVAEVLGVAVPTQRDTEPPFLPADRQVDTSRGRR